MTTRGDAQRQRVLAALDAEHTYGYDLRKASKVRPGRLYPILADLETEGIVGAFWDNSTPRRRCYYLINHDYFKPRQLISDPEWSSE